MLGSSQWCDFGKFISDGLCCLSCLLISLLNDWLVNNSARGKKCFGPFCGQKGRVNLMGNTAKDWLKKKSI